MRVLVTGGTGFLGSHLCARLVQEGYEVTVLRRATSDLGALAGLEVRHVVGDVTETESVSRAVRMQEIVIHAAALVGFAPLEAHRAVNEGGTRNIVIACQRHGVERLVHISSVAAIGIPKNRCCPADESFAFDLEGGALGYNISKRRAEEVVTRAVAEGLDAVIVNPSWIHGPNGRCFRGHEIPDGVRRRPIVPCFSGGINVVHIDDAVDGVVAALRRGRAGQRYILGGENLTWREMARLAADMLGIKRVLVTVPPLVTGLAAWAGRAIAPLTSHRPRHTYDVCFSGRFRFYDSRKAVEELGFTPRPYAEIVRQYVDGDWLRAARRWTQSPLGALRHDEKVVC
jgi:dihydroflavonol-4-reductase